MEKRALVALMLSLLVLLVWEFWISPEGVWFKRSETPPPAPTQTETQAPPPSPTPDKPITLEGLPGRQVMLPSGTQEFWNVASPYYRMQIVSAGARLQYFKLNKYRQSIDPKSAPMELITTQGSGYLPLAVDFVQHPTWELATRPYQSGAGHSLELAPSGGEQSLEFLSENPGQFRITKSFSFAPQTYIVDVMIRLQNLSAEPISDQMGISLYFGPLGSPAQETSYNKSHLTAFKEGSLETLEIKDIIKKSMAFGASLQWIGYQNNFFIQALMPVEPNGFQVIPRVLDEKSGLLQVVYLTDPFQLAAGAEKTVKLQLYLGPKEIPALKAAGHQLAAAVDYGWFDFLAKPLLYSLNWFYKYTHNYGVAIIILTVIIKILFWPLTHKSYKSMQAMKKLQPKMAKLREKYKDNREKLNEELMALYRTHKVNPLGGCLPMILQIPVFFALYRMLYSSVDLLHQPFALWINDLTAPDRLDIGIPIPYLGALPVLTLLMGATMFIQQKMTPTTGDPRQEKMMLMMPVVFTIMFVNFPSGLVLYWLVNNVLSIAQQYWINRHA